MRTRSRKVKALMVTSIALATTGATFIAGVPAQSAQTSITVTPWLTGLNAPRGVAFDGSGRFYVSESGLGGPNDFGLTHTGRVKRFERGSTTPTWNTHFASLYARFAPPPAPADVLGPEGLSVLRQGCRPPVPTGGDCQLRMIQSESNLGTGTTNPQIGRLFRLNRLNGKPTTLSDVGNQQWKWTKNHPNGAEPLPDSNPYGVLITRMGPLAKVRTFVADAGANTISEIMPLGRTRVIALIPNDTPEHDSTPTCITKGPDGMLYVATLDLIVNDFGNNPGHSNVWRVNPNANYPTQPTLWATGLTTVTACTTDRSGNFWGTEMFAPNNSGAPGDIVRIPFSDRDHVTHFGLGRLPLPGGITQGPDGAMYVSINSAAPGPAGEVVRVVVN